MVDIIKEIKKDIEKGEEAVEELVEKGEKAVENLFKGKKKKSSAKSKKSKEEPGELSGEELEKAAEEESVKPDIEKKKAELLAKAEKLKQKVVFEGPTSEELKEQIKIKKRTDMLIPLEDYVKSGIYLGTKVVTPAMKPFVYRRRADGLAIFNTDLIDEKLKESIDYLAKYDSKDVILVCKRQAGWRVAEKFGELTGIRVFTKKYPAGVLTNTSLPDFFENELTIITDSWLDKNALNDTLIVRKKVLMVCDTNNFAKGADQIIIGNNKSPKSLGVILYLLTRGYMKAKGLDTNKIPDLEWWMGEE